MSDTEQDFDQIVADVSMPTCDSGAKIGGATIPCQHEATEALHVVDHGCPPPARGDMLACRGHAALIVKDPRIVCSHCGERPEIERVKL